MNLGLFRSLHGLVASLLVGGFLLWLALGRDRFGEPLRAGAGDGSGVPFLLATGWAALACYVVLVLYAWRKHAQANRFTPEFGAEIPLEKLIDATHEQFDEKDKEDLYYHQSFSVMYFFMQNTKGKAALKFAETLRETKDVKAADATLFGKDRKNLKKMENLWKGYTLKLEVKV